MTSAAGFTIGLDGIGRLGRGLSRPENVLGFRDGTVFASSNRGHITRIMPDGAQVEFGDLPGGQPTTMALESDHALIVNNTADGNLYRLRFDGVHELYLDAIDGEPIGSANYVFRDGRGRLWIAVATRRSPPHQQIIVEPDGYIAVVDEEGPRIVADGLFWPNEIRFDADQRFAYVPETFGRRVMRFEVGDDAVLRNRRVWGPDPLSETSAPDGIALDADGNVWVAIISRNGLVIIDGSGDAHTVFEDPNDVALRVWLKHFDSGVIPMSAIRDCAGPRLQLPTSVGFCGQDLRTVVMGSLAMSSLLTFRSPTAGLPLAHQARPQAPPQPTVAVRPRIVDS